MRTNTPLYYAICGGWYDACVLLMESGANIDTTLLHIAIEYDRINICELLLDCGIDVNDSCNKHGPSIHKAIERGNTDICRLLLDRGASLEDIEDYVAPLYYAVGEEQYDICKLLIERGADVNYRFKNQSGYRGSILKEAICNNHVGILRLLIDNGIDLNQRCGGKTALEYAMKHSLMMYDMIRSAMHKR